MEFMLCLCSCLSSSLGPPCLEARVGTAQLQGTGGDEGPRCHVPHVLITLYMGLLGLLQLLCLPSLPLLVDACRLECVSDSLNYIQWGAWVTGDFDVCGSPSLQISLRQNELRIPRQLEQKVQLNFRYHSNC